MSKHKIAKLHTPEELLAGAQSLSVKDDPHFNRAVVLEAITALEAYVEQIVFSLLDQQLDPLLVKWIKSKSKMDFDSRLSVFVPLATKQPVDTGDNLWQRYKEAKTIRNQVTHSGRMVSSGDARKVLKTVYDWLSYLGSTVELDLVFLSLKKYLERSREQVKKRGYEEVEAFILDYFRSSGVAEAEAGVIFESGTGDVCEADIVLAFGEKRIALEIRRFNKGMEKIDERMSRAINHVSKLIFGHSFDGAAIILLSEGVLPKKYQGIEKELQGRVTLVPVSL